LYDDNVTNKVKHRRDFKIIEKIAEAGEKPALCNQKKP
jgi:hypothetical protein